MAQLLRQDPKTHGNQSPAPVQQDQALSRWFDAGKCRGPYSSFAALASKDKPLRPGSRTHRKHPEHEADEGGGQQANSTDAEGAHRKREELRPQQDKGLRRARRAEQPRPHKKWPRRAPAECRQTSRLAENKKRKAASMPTAAIYIPQYHNTTHEMHHTFFFRAQACCNSLTQHARGRKFT